MKRGHEHMQNENLLNTLKRASANATDVYFDLYESYFESGAEPEEALQIILEYPLEIGDVKDKHPQSITQQNESRLTLTFEDIIQGTANRIVQMNLSEKDFYKKLYTTIFCSDSDLYPKSKEEKVIALKILSERVGEVPYYQIKDFDKVSKEEFEDTIERLYPNLQEAFYMLQHQFETTPELAAQIIRIADDIADERERIVFWTVIINKLQSDEKD